MIALRKPMEDKRLAIDFIFPPEYREEPRRNAAPRLRLGTCLCGADTYVLANEMKSGNGVPSSRMYECTACGNYRLG